MGTFITIIQVLTSLSLLVVLHECGHFFPAKWFNTKVEKFYLFFNPWFSLFKIQRGETEYGIGWLPAGGYVKIAGMIDESFDKEQMKLPPQPWEFRSKPAWQRLIIMLGGVIVNFILGVLIFSFMTWNWGVDYVPVENVKNGIAVDSVGLEIGLRDGDNIVKIGDTPFTRFDNNALKKGVIFDGVDKVTIERDGVTKTLDIDSKWIGFFTNPKNKFSVFEEQFSKEIANVVEGSIADKLGLEVGDEILSLDGLTFTNYNQFDDAVVKAKGNEMAIKVVRNSMDTLLFNTSLAVDERLGISPSFAGKINESFGFLASFPKGVEISWDFLSGQVTAFKMMFQGKIRAKDSLGSFITIGKQFGTNWDWKRFWRMTAMLSILLGFINLLPIPALDGGHALFLIYELVSGRKPSDKFLEWATLGGFIILVALMIFALGLDISRLF